MPDLALFAPRRPLTLETILTDPEWFGLTTASPVQRAICRAADGIPLGELASDPDVIASFGGPDIDGRVNRSNGRGIDNPQGRAAIAMLPRERPDSVALCSGIRGGKSLLSSAAAVRAAITCDVSRLGVGEIPRVPIVATSVDTAKPTWEVLVGRVTASPKARELIIGEPTTERIMLRHPTGRPIEIRVVAGARAASTLVARWIACAIFDEAPRMLGEDDGVVNLDHMLKAIALRMLPGAQILLPGSPWAPMGPIYDRVQEHFGKPSKAIVVVRSSGPMMNPFIWDDEKVATAIKKPDEWRVDGLGDFMDPESGLLTTEAVGLCKRGELVVGKEDRRYYAAAMDPATRGNAWTLVVRGNRGAGRSVIALAKQWIGSQAQPLRGSVVFPEMAELLKPFGVTRVFTDQWAIDALQDTANQAGLWLTETKIGFDDYKRVQALVTEQKIELPPDPQLVQDLAGVRRRVTPDGVKIILPKTADGRHCDYAPALARVCSTLLQDPDPDPHPTTGPEAEALEAAAAKEAARLEVVRRIQQKNRGMRQGWRLPGQR